MQSHPSETSLIDIRNSVAVIGAGIAGAIVARRLADRGHEVRVFDKGRGVGGRMSTRREGDCAFDHGCQFFTVRDDRFRSYVEAWQDAGWVSPWRHRLAHCDRGSITMARDETVRFVGVPGMNAMIKGMLSDIPVHLATRVRSIREGDAGWQLESDDGPIPDSFDWVIVTAPSAQAAELLAPSPRLQAKAASVRMQPCWAVMAMFDFEMDAPFEAAFVQNSPLVWIANGGSKPGRAAHEAWVLHASPGWSRSHLEEKPERVIAALLDAFYEALGTKPVAPSIALAHRWRYAAPENPLDIGFLWDEDLGLGAAGDWCLNARVENAFLSGFLLADHLLAGQSGAVQ
ncbi:MAG: FAD-dependent oxidoreductase [Kiritimatiellae bacterium]|nr:FAD-dependent oxidoreductase [Kiritimatiellia bacterium]MDW8457860.1 FAD-dependent oxidoreductase [Verrucomicrobiota bacterium]